MRIRFALLFILSSFVLALPAGAVSKKDLEAQTLN